MPTTRRCAECGTPLPDEVPEGACPVCALRGALELPDVPSKAPVTEKPGDRIGRYKLLEQIGEGGCGVVYVAEQEEPVRRRVALKIIKLGMDTKAVVARFEAERQALAMMDHPNIAKVLDGGATETGRPFFVMELVKGVRITDYCDRNILSTAERLGLFIQVCHAIQHAHQKGIIHRDIKPSNILVTLHDGVPVPKVIDFGIAKATTDQRLTDKTLYTAIEQFVGTPAYMSPEQAELSGLDVDTRSDVYSLGVLLYELLTGKTPFDAKRFVEAGLDEIRRIIREEDPPRPSTRISTLDAGEQTAIAKRCHAELPKLLGLVHGDLDWIVMKTLEKDRTRRYETANGLASDIERHLNNEPVVARPPSNLYRLQKMARRNKLAFAAAGAVTAALVIGLGVSTWMFFNEKEARQRAVAAEQQQARLREEAEASRKAEALLRQEAEAAEKKRRVLLSEFAGEVTSGADHTERSELQKNLEDALANDRERWPNNPEEWEGSLRGLTEVLKSKGQYAKAEGLLREELAVKQKHWPDETEKWAGTLDALALTLQGQGKYAEAAQITRLNGTRGEAAEFLRDMLELDEQTWPNDPSKWVSTLNDVAVLFQEQGKYSKVKELFGQALALADGVHAHNAALLCSRGFFHGWHGRWNEAAADLARALEAEPAKHWTWYLLAPVLAQSEDLPAYQKHCHAMLARFGPAESPIIALRTAVVCAFRPVTGDDLDKASKLADKAVSISMFEMWSPEYESYPWAPFFLLGKGLTEYRQGQFASAVDWLQRALTQAKQEASLKGEHTFPDLDLAVRQAQTQFVLGMALYELKKPDEARDALADGKKIAQDTLPQLNSGDLTDRWPDVLIANSLMREAMQLIESSVSTDKQSR